MKQVNKIRTLVISLLILLHAVNTYSQATIGSDIEPQKGSLLDLKQNSNTGVNSTKGLMLPRVALKTKSDLTPIIDNSSEEEKESHTGLLVYNTTDNVYFCPCIEVWTGDEWTGVSTDKNISALSDPNSYILIPGQSINIPVRKAYAVWYKYFQECKGSRLSGIVSAEVYWEDQENLISNTLNSDYNLPVTGMSEDAQIVVEAKDVNKKGNAVITVRIGPEGNANDSIRWSWHIWVTDDPTTTTFSYDNNGDGIDDFTFMDRNLGAVSTSADDGIMAIGLLYQWGRKDPFPSSAAIATVREPTLYGRKTGVTKLLVSENYNLKTTVVNPLNFFYGNNNSEQDWYSNSNIHNDELWNNFDNEKSPFDPCPKGWRLPIYKNVLSPWNDFTTDNFVATAITATQARGRIRGDDFYTSGGYRYQLSPGGLQRVGTNAYYWTATPSQVGALCMYIGNAATGSNSVLTNVYARRAVGGCVRCVKE